MIRKIFTIMFVAALVLTGCGQRGYVQLGGYAQGGTWSVKYNPEGGTLPEGVKGRSPEETREVSSENGRKVIGGIRSARSAGRPLPNPATVQKGIEAILEAVDTTLSGYNKRSQLSRLNAGDTLVPSPMLMEMYRRAYTYWRETGGALDCAAGPLFDIWGFGFRNDSLPGDDAVRKALAVSGMGRLVPDMAGVLLPDGRICSSRLLRDGNGMFSRHSRLDRESLETGKDARSLPGMTKEGPTLNFNAIAQGYTADTVANYLASLGIYDMLVDIGEIRCRGVNPAGKPWRIGVDRPEDGNDTPGAQLQGIWESSPISNSAPKEISADNGSPAAEAGFQGIVTSGNYRKFYIRDGRKYSHTIDPRTGYPVGMGPGTGMADRESTPLLSATIVAPTSEAADAYATYCMVIGLEESQKFIESRPDLEGFLIYSSTDGIMAEWRSEGFHLAETVEGNH